MKRAVAVFAILFFIACSVFAADGSVGTGTPEGEVLVTLDLASESVNYAEVGFSSAHVEGFGTPETSLPDVLLNLDPASGHAFLNEGLYVYARIQYPKACKVTLSVKNGLMGYANEAAANADSSLENGVELGWEITTTKDDPTTDIKTNPIYAGGTRTTENLDAVVFNHDGTTHATMAYSLPLTIRTDDYRGLEANYFAQYITVTVEADSTTP